MEADLLKVIFFARSEFSLIKFCAELCAEIAKNANEILKNHCQIVPTILNCACFANFALKKSEILENSCWDMRLRVRAF